MDIKYFPDHFDVNIATTVDAPLLMLISFDEEITIIADIDYDYSDDIIVKFQEYSRLDVVENNFRIFLNSKGAEWNFYCPQNYKGIQDKNKLNAMILNTEKDFPSFQFYKKNGFEDYGALVIIGK